MDILLKSAFANHSSGTPQSYQLVLYFENQSIKLDKLKGKKLRQFDSPYFSTQGPENTQKNQKKSQTTKSAFFFLTVLISPKIRMQPKNPLTRNEYSTSTFNSPFLSSDLTYIKMDAHELNPASERLNIPDREMASRLEHLRTSKMLNSQICMEDFSNSYHLPLSQIATCKW